MNGEFYTHIHMSAGDADGKVFGGHLNRAIVSATCEMVIHIIEGTVDRRLDEEIGLNLFRFYVIIMVIFLNKYFKLLSP